MSLLNTKQNVVHFPLGPHCTCVYVLMFARMRESEGEITFKKKKKKKNEWESKWSYLACAGPALPF